MFIFCRWSFATHGCIFGFSRLIVFLNCCTSNTSRNVARSFQRSCNQYCLPHRVRCDHGLENVHVGVIIINILRGENRGSIITRESVHSQRIERMWPDVFKEVASSFYAQFYRMEDAGILVADDPVQCAQMWTDNHSGWLTDGIHLSTEQLIVVNNALSDNASDETRYFAVVS